MFAPLLAGRRLTGPGEQTERKYNAPLSAELAARCTPRHTPPETPSEAEWDDVGGAESLEADASLARRHVALSHRVRTHLAAAAGTGDALSAAALRSLSKGGPPDLVGPSLLRLPSFVPFLRGAATLCEYNDVVKASPVALLSLFLSLSPTLLPSQSRLIARSYWWQTPAPGGATTCSTRRRLRQAALGAPRRCPRATPPA